MPQFNCHYNILIDETTHPGFKTEDEAIAIAKTMTDNCSDFNYEGEEDSGVWYLVFIENILIEAERQEDLEFAKISPCCKDAEFSGVSPLRKVGIRGGKKGRLSTFVSLPLGASFAAVNNITILSYYLVNARLR